ncbi:fibronectin type III domain-containing protein [Micromonospora sp. WMMD736]|uniref:fibronectin type III domain-containing protein n=1 Tax=Micromonospora sp. WMMD736 TaxID=3404112 RepID=UPI003B926CF9
MSLFQQGLRRTVNGAIALSLAVGALIAMPTRAEAVAALPTGGMSAAALNAMFTQYGNAGSHWTGGDRTFSVLLPDGRLAWLFSDTFLGSVNSDGSRPVNSPMVHNTLVVQEGSALTATLHGGTSSAPKSLMCDDSVGLGCWVAGAVVTGNNLEVLVNRYEATGPGNLDVAPTGNALVTLSLPALTVTQVRELPYSPRITWGQSVVNDNGYTYVYGSEHTADFKFAHVARVPIGGLAGQWQFWNGAAWSTDENASARIVSGVGTAFTVSKLDGRYVMTTVDTHLVFNNVIVAYFADSPTGPFSGPTELARAPEAGNAPPTIVYDTSVHQALARPGKLLLSYNVNALNTEDSIADVSIYRPRFIEIDWPRAVPDPTRLPAAPTNLSATADAVGGVHVAWQGPTGQGLKYWIYQRDTTAEQIQWVRLPASTGATSIDLTLLRDEHLYEYKVTAENEVGEGQASNTASATVRVEPPPAPTGLTATPKTTGDIVLNWQPAERAWYYQVERLDITAGKTEWLPLAHPDGSATTLTVSLLDHQAEYEFRVRSVGGGGEGPWSSTARATASYAVPAAPSGLVATARSNGDVALSWTAPPGRVWHRVYQRDVTAGETTFTAWPLPVVDMTTATATYLLHGHEYEFKVAATNQGGESAHSNTARATATFPLPGAPTSLTATRGDGQATLSWQAPGPNVWYRVYQRDVTADEAAFTPWPYPVTEGTTAKALYLANGHQYEFKVSATNGAGEGPASNVAAVTPAPALPAAPASLSAVAKSDGTIQLSWQAVSTNVWYRVYQRDVTAGESAFKAWPYPVTEGTAATAQYLTHGHRYEFKVAATNAAGEGPSSTAASATSSYALPGAPTNLRAAAMGEGKIELNWDTPVAGAYSAIYWRDVTAGQSTFTRLEYLSSETSITMEYLLHAHVYEYRVAAMNVAGEGPKSSSVQATAYYSLPSPPSNLSAQAGDGKVTLSWSRSATPNAQYFVYSRDTTAGQSWQRTPLPIDGNSITMQFLENGHWYDFRVTATNAGGQSPASNTVSAKPLPPLPAPPSNLTARAGDGEATLSWTASTFPNAYYLIEYRDVTAGQSWRRAEYPVPGGTSITMGFLSNGHVYEYRVRASNVAGESSPSNVVSVRPMPPIPQAPSGLKVTSVGCGSVTLSWTPSATKNVYHWIEYRDATSGQNWTRGIYPIVGVSAIKMDILINTHTYQFRMLADNISGESPLSNTVSAKPVAPTPGPARSFYATPGDARVDLKWSRSTTTDCGVPYYQVQLRNKWERRDWTAVYNTTDTAFTWYTDNSRDVYEFRVVAINESASSYSAVASEVPFWVPSASTVVRSANTWNQSNAAALTWAAAHGSSCFKDLWQKVCFGETPPIGDQPQTTGDYFFFKGRDRFKERLRYEARSRVCLQDKYGRAVAESSGPDLMRHEAFHAQQWTTYKIGAPAFFLKDYGAAVGYSKLHYHNPWEGNYFEITANLRNGGYGDPYDDSCDFDPNN